MAKKLSKNRAALLSLIFLTAMILLAIFAPFFTRFSFEEQDIVARLQGPSWTHWMGTDTLGRDLYSRIIYGSRVSLAVGVVTALVSVGIGIVVGMISGFYGGWIDIILMRTVDLLFIFPSTLLAILMMVFFGRGMTGVLVAIGITSWVSQARLVRAQVMLARELPYVEAAKSVGASHFRILYKHILPNLWGPVIASVTIQIPTNIMSESFLSFIGLGLQPPYSSWGTLANEGFRAMHSYPYLIFFPGLFLFITLLAFQYLGDSLNRSASGVSV